MNAQGYVFKSAMVSVIFICCFLTGCKNSSENNEGEILSQVFPYILYEMRVPVNEPFIQALPVISANEDSCIAYDSLESYVMRLSAQQYEFEELVLRQVYLNNEKNTTIIVYDSLSVATSLSPHLKQSLPSEQYVGAVENIEKQKGASSFLKIENLSDFPFLKLEYYSKFKDQTAKIGETLPNGSFLAGVMYFSHIYFSDDEKHGVFFCTFKSGKTEPMTKLFCIELVDGKWTLKAAVLVS